MSDGIFCTKCESVKPESEYEFTKVNPEKLYKWCNPCREANPYVTKIKPRAAKRTPGKAPRYLQDEFMDRHSSRAAKWGCKGATKSTRLTWAQWKYIEWYYGYRCLACGAAKNIHADHVVPLWEKGSNTWDNIQPLCRKCNMAKSIATIDYRNGNLVKEIPEEFQGVYYKPYGRQRAS